MDKLPKEKNVQIPLSLFNRIVELMDSLIPPDADDDPILLVMFNAVKYGLRSKRINMMHRKNYSAVVCAENDIQRKVALKEYVNTKVWYSNKNN